MNNNSNRDYATENINLKQQIMDLEVANKDKAETIKALKQELLEYNQLRNRFKVLYEENQELLVNTNLAQGIALKYKKALDLACERLNWDCPAGQNCDCDSLDCENRCKPDICYEKCWEKYFLNLADVEVIKND